MFQMVPHLFIGVPVGRVFRQVKDMQTRLALDERLRLLRDMRRRLIHHHDQVAATVMPQHLLQKLNHLGRGDPLIVQPEDQLPAAGDGRQSRDAPRLPVTRCFGVWPRGAQVLPKKAVSEILASS